MRILRQVLIAAMITLILSGCGNAADKTNKQTATTKGVQHGMKTYYIGRFAIDMPEEFKLEVRSQSIYHAEVSDFKWASRDHAAERDALWAKKISEVERLKLPKTKKHIVIEEDNLKGFGVWARAVEYYGDYRIGDYIYWTILVDYEGSGLWLTLYGEDNDLTKKNFRDILSHYQYGFDGLTKNSFCLHHGRLELPYEEQEKTYARFAGPMGMMLEVEMEEIHRPPKQGGIMSRTIAAIATGFAAGVDYDKIRSHKKTAAGLPGEEEILIGNDGENRDLSFDWEYLGSVESGEQPWIQITCDSEPDNLDEKIKIWDKVLGSFRPAYKR